MRVLRAALLCLLAPALFAQGEIRFFTDHKQISPSVGAHVFIESDGHPPLTDVVVRFQVAPGMALDALTPAGNDWTCSRGGNVYTCSTPTFETGRTDGFLFIISTSSTIGGIRGVSVSLSAQNLATRTIDFEVLTSVQLQVTTSEDFGPRSLRAAIEAVNENPLCGTIVPCTISFSHNMTVAPFAPLPAIRKCNVALRGPDFLFTKGIAISGENATFGNGLEVRAACAPGIGGVSISGLAIHSWPWNGIYFEAPSETAHGHLVTNCNIGTDLTGYIAKPNRSRGIVTDSPHEIFSIYQSIVSGNGRSGIALFRGKSATIVSMKIGTDPELKPLGNGASGIFTNGVPLLAGSSTIAFNAHAGISGRPGTQSAVSFNSIHTNGGLPIDWGLDGPTPPDDESDGILNAPRITDAFYDAAEDRTVIRGVVRLRNVHPGFLYAIEPYRATTPRGDILERIATFPQFVQPPADGSAGDVVFEILLPGNRRGTLIALQTYAGPPPLASGGVSSEISAAVAVR